jgi:hypothetical protein
VAASVLLVLAITVSSSAGVLERLLAPTGPGRIGYAPTERSMACVLSGALARAARRLAGVAEREATAVSNPWRSVRPAVVASDRCGVCGAGHLGVRLGWLLTNLPPPARA